MPLPYILAAAAVAAVAAYFVTRKSAAPAPTNDPTLLAQRVLQTLALGPQKYSRDLVKQFQAAAFVPVTGLYNAETRAALQTYLPGARAPVPFAGPQTGSAYLPPVPGAEGDDWTETVADGIKVTTQVTNALPGIIDSFGRIFGSDEPSNPLENESEEALLRMANAGTITWEQHDAEINRRNA